MQISFAQRPAARRWLVPLLILLSGATSFAEAQIQRNPGAATRPPREEPTLPPANLEPLPQPQFELPTLQQQPEPSPTVRDGPTLALNRVDFDGNTAIEDAALQAIAEPYVGREVSLEEMFRLRDALTLAYVNEGYVNSGAVLPDQEVIDGVVRFLIVEGSLEDVVVNNTEHLDADFVAARLAQGSSVPLDVNALQERLQLVILDPSVRRVDARLGPGSEAGQARLEVDVEEERPFGADLTFSNNQSTSIGSNHAGLGLTLRNVVGRMDRLRVFAGASEGLGEAVVDYALPLRPNLLTAYVRGELSRSEIVTPDVNTLDIESETDSITVGLLMPVIETTSNRVELDLSFMREHNETTLLDEPFSFSPGAEDGETDLSLVRFAQRWQNRGTRRALSFGSTFTAGLDILGATDNDGNEPDGEFFAWLGQIEVAQRLFSDSDQLVARGELQLTADPLLASEQFAAGGIDSVRGYRVNEIVRDNGWTAGIEYRYPILDLLDEGLVDDETTFELVPFFDAGGGFKHSGRDDPAEADALFAPGIGLRYARADWLSAEVYVGFPLTGQDGATNDALQENGVSFRVRFIY